MTGTPPPNVAVPQASTGGCSSLCCAARARAVGRLARQDRLRAHPCLAASARLLQVPLARSPSSSPHPPGTWTRAAFPGILSRSLLFASSLLSSSPPPSIVRCLTEKRQHRRLPERSLESGHLRQANRCASVRPFIHSLICSLILRTPSFF